MLNTRVACFDIIPWAENRHFSLVEKEYRKFASHSNIEDLVRQYVGNFILLVDIYSLGIHKEQRNHIYYRDQITKISKEYSTVVFIKDHSDEAEIEKLCKHLVLLGKTTYSISGIIAYRDLVRFLEEAETLPKRMEF